MADVVEAVAARLESQIPSRTVYRHAVPSNPAPLYLVVRSNVGDSLTVNLSGFVDGRQPVAWVTSVARGIDAQDVGRKAAWGSEHAVTALMDFRFTLGRATWLPEHVGSQPVGRDDELPDFVMFSVDQFLIQYQP